MRYLLVVLTLFWSTVSLCANEPNVADSSTFDQAHLVFRRAGFASSIDEWQRITKGLYRAVAPDEHERLQAIEVEELSAWIESHAADRVGQIGTASLVQLIESANLDYLYAVDPGTGEIRYDAAGDTVLQGAAGWESGDAQAYRTRLESHAETLVTEWEARYNAEVDAIIGLVGGALASQVRSRVGISLNDYRRRIEGDHARLIDQATSRAAYGRLMDTYSERRKSEERNAESVAASLVRETNDELGGVADALAALIPGTNSPTEDLRIDVEQWQASFRRGFESGMAAWERAEQRFFQERIAWEEETQAAYAEAEHQWDGALQALSEARNTWVADMQAVVVGGSAQWDATEYAFERDYAREMEQMRAAAEAEVQRLQDELNAYVEVFEQAAQIVSLAERNAWYLQEQIKAQQDVLGEVRSDIVSYTTSRNAVRDQLFSSHRLVMPTLESALDFLGYAGRPLERLIVDTVEEWDSVARKYIEVPIYESDEEYAARMVNIARFVGNDPNLVNAYLKDRLGYDYFDRDYATHVYWGGYHHIGVGDPADGTYPEGVRLARSILDEGEIVNVRRRTAAAPEDIVYFNELIGAARIDESELLGHIAELERELAYWHGADGSGGVKRTYTDLAYEVWNSVEAIDATFSSGTGAYGEVDRERARLERTVEMLAAQVAVARRVAQYADDASSNRPTEAQTQAMYADARDDFGAAQGAYRAALDALTRANRELLPSAQDALAAAQAALEAEQGALDAATESYQLVYDTWMARSTHVFDAVINAAEDLLRQWNEVDESDANTRAGAYKAYAERWETYQQASTYEQARIMIDDIRGRDERNDFTDLSDLEARADSLAALTIDWADPGLSAETTGLLLVHAGVSTDDRAYRRFMESFGNALAAEAGSIWETLTESALAGIVHAARMEAYEALQIEQLLSSGTVGPEDAGATTIAALTDAAESAIDAARSALGEARVALERGAIDYLLRPEEAVPGAVPALARAWLDAFPHAWTLSIPAKAGEEPLPILSGEARTALEARLALLVAAADSGEYGGSVDPADSPFSLGGFDLAQPYLSDHIEAWDRREAELTVVQRYAHLAPAVVMAERTVTAATVSDIVQRITAESGPFTRTKLNDYYGELAQTGAPAYVMDTVAMYVRRVTPNAFSFAGATAVTAAEEASVVAEELGEALSAEEVLSYRPAAEVWKGGYDGGEDHFRVALRRYLEGLSFFDLDAEQQADELATIVAPLGLEATAVEIDLAWLSAGPAELDVRGIAYDAQSSTEDPVELVVAAYPEARRWEVSVAAARLIAPHVDDDAIRYMASALYRQYALTEALDRADALASARDFARWAYAAKGYDTIEGGTYTGTGAYKAILESAVTVFESNEPRYTPGDVDYEDLLREAQAARSSVFSSEQRMAREVESLAQAKALRDAYEASSDDYYTRQVVPKSEEVRAAKTDLETARGDYLTALSDFEAAVGEYNALVVATDVAKGAYHSARLELQVAEEIADYARSGYSSDELDPQAVLTRRQEEYARALEAQGAIDGVGTTATVMTRLNAALAATLADEGSRQEALLQGRIVAGTLSLSSGRVQAKRDAQRSNLAGSAAAMVRFDDSGLGDTLAFAPDWDVVAPNALVARAATFDSPASYFSGTADAVSERFSTDVASWLVAMRGREEDLRTFGIAWYYEAVSRDLFSGEEHATKDIDINDATDHNYRTLLKDWVSLPIGNVYTTHPETGAPVYSHYAGDDEAVGRYLKQETQRSYNAVSGDAAYRFFRLMMRSGRVAFDTAFIEQDVAEIIRARVDRLAKEKQDSYSRWWRTFKRRRARQIKSLRQSMERDDGSRERSELFTTIDDAHGYYTAHQAAVAELAGVTGGNGTDANETIGIARAAAVGAISAELEGAIRRVFAASTPDNALDAINRAVTRLGTSLATTNAQVDAQMGQLGAQWEADRAAYEALLSAYIGGGDTAPSWEAVETAMDAAFRNNDYFASAVVRSRLQTAESGLAPPDGMGAQIARYGTAIRTVGARAIADYREQVEAMIADRGAELALEREELARRRERWQVQTTELLSVASAEWSGGYTRIVGMRKSWQERTQEDYKRRSALWNARYALLQSGRAEWIKEATATAMTVSAEAMGLDLAGDANRSIAASETLLIQNGIEALPDLNVLVEETVKSPTLTAVIERAGELAQRGRGRTVVAAYLPRMNTGGNAHRLAVETTSAIGEEISQRAALVTALQMAEQVRLMEAGLLEGVEGANESVERGLRNQMQNAGYRRRGTYFTRKAIIDESLLGGVEREEQRVGAYRWFLTPEMELGVDLSRESLEGRSARIIQATVTVAQKALEDYQALIFGRDEDKSEWDYTRISEEFEEHFAVAKAAYKGSAGYNRTNSDGEAVNQETEGLFNWHVGYAPQMNRENPEQVSEAGYGEMGRIMEAFLRNEARANRGPAMLDTPMYSLKLWDDDADNDGESDGLLGAPSIKSITNLAVSVAAYSAGVGPLVTAALNLVDDAVFTVADVATGYRDAGSAFGGFALQAGASMASASVGGAFSGFDAAPGGDTFLTGGFNGMLEGTTQNMGTFASTTIDIGMGAAQSVATNAASSTVSSFDFTTGRFNTDQIYEGTFGESAWASYAGSAAGTAVTAGLNWVVDGTIGQEYGQVSSLNRLVGSAANAGIQYGMTGQTTLNILNAADLSGGNLTGGLLELNLGGEGSLLNMGSGGIGMSAVQMAKSLGGLKTYGRNVRIAASGYWGKEAVAARMLATSGLSETEALFEQLMSGEAVLTEGGTGGRAQTVAANGRKEIRLGAGSREGSRYQLGLTLAHEAFRDGLDNGVTGQNRETMNSVVGHTLVAQQVAGIYGGENLTGLLRDEVEMLAYAQRTGDYSIFGGHVAASYDSSADYWKLTQGADGNWGWQEDQSLDFDLSELPPDKRAAVEEALRLNGSGLTADGRVRHEDMDEAIIDIVAGTVVGEASSNPWATRGPGETQRREELSIFAGGTDQFVQVSSIAAGMMAGGVTNAGIAAFDQALVAAQESGLLVRNEVNIGPFDPNNPIIFPNEGDYGRLSSDVGYRSLMYNGIAHRREHLGQDFYFRNAQGERYEDGVVGVRAGQETSVELRYNDVFGINVTATGDTVRGRYSHLHSNTVMDYLAAFGTQGVTATGNGLTGVPAGMRVGSIGNTGMSTGQHLDFITEFYDPENQSWIRTAPTQVYSALSHHQETPWSQAFSGDSQLQLTSDDVFDMWNHGGVQNSGAYEPWENEAWMTLGALDLAELLRIWD